MLENWDSPLSFHPLHLTLGLYLLTKEMVVSTHFVVKFIRKRKVNVIRNALPMVVWWLSRYIVAEKF